MEILSMKLDVTFKSFFTSDSEILQGFISDVLEIPYESIKEIIIENPEIPAEDITGKFSRLDLKLRIEDKIINIELQINREKSFADRSLFYWAKMYTNGLPKGAKYSELKQSIAINIIDFNMFEWEDYHSKFLIKEKDKGKVLTDKFEMHFCELKKLNKEINAKDKRELWMRLINAKSEEELDMLSKTSAPTIQRAVVKLKQMSEDDRLKERARMREKAIHDEASALGAARQEGREEGKWEKTQKFAFKMLAKNSSDEEIIDMLDISINELEQLKSEYAKL